MITLDAMNAKLDALTAGMNSVLAAVAAHDEWAKCQNKVPNAEARNKYEQDRKEWAASEAKREEGLQALLKTLTGWELKLNYISTVLDHVYDRTPAPCRKSSRRKKGGRK